MTEDVALHGGEKIDASSSAEIPAIIDIRIWETEGLSTSRMNSGLIVNCVVRCNGNLD